MSDADRKLGEEMAMMHIGGLVELGIIPPTLADTVVLEPNVNPDDVRKCLVEAVNYGWQVDGADGRCNVPANFVGWLLQENERLREELRGALCPGGGYTGQPRDEYPDVAACLKAGVCGCSLGAALAPKTGGK